MDNKDFNCVAQIRGLCAHRLALLYGYSKDPRDWPDAPNGVTDSIRHQLRNVLKTGPRQPWAWPTDDRLIRCIDPDYPAQLWSLPKPPKQLWVRGRALDLSRPMSAVVGSRNASIDGRKIAYAAAASALDQGHLVVSGGARGIDAAAHKGALAGTVAVMAGGLDHWYPRECFDLFHRIQEHGVLISEMPPGTQPKANLFPVRNRIIAGLCQRLLVVQGCSGSGSLITARQALDMNREIWAVPGSPLLDQAQGPNELIRDGAQVWLMDSYWGQIQVVRRQPNCPVSHALAENHYTVAELSQALGWNLSQVLARLTQLKLSGCIRMSAGRYGWKI